jgi:putative transposase
VRRRGGCSRFVAGWDLREQMTEREIAVILQRAREKFLLARPRVISDNGPQFIARDFKEFIRLCGMRRGPDVALLPAVKR